MTSTNLLYILIWLSLGCNNSSTTQHICIDNKVDTIESLKLTERVKLKQKDTKTIRVEGILHYEFEDCALYPELKSYSHYALWLSFYPNLKNREHVIEKMKGKRVRVVGKLNLGNKAHDGSYRGTLDSVSCIVLVY